MNITNKKQTLVGFVVTLVSPLLHAQRLTTYNGGKRKTTVPDYNIRSSKWYPVQPERLFKLYSICNGDNEKKSPQKIAPFIIIAYT